MASLSNSPSPPHLSHIPVEDLVNFEKDVDGLHRYNMGKLCRKENQQSLLAPCTPKGIIRLLEYYDIPLKGKDVTIIGRGAIVGTPLALMMTSHDATVTLCHSKTKDIKKFTTRSDVIVSAVGRAGFVDESFIGPNRPTVIDVGINFVEGKLCGDVQFDDVWPLCSAITPVPGGVGPMTILSLTHNLVLAAQRAKRP